MSNQCYPACVFSGNGDTLELLNEFCRFHMRRRSRINRRRHVTQQGGSRRQILKSKSPAGRTKQNNNNINCNVMQFNTSSCLKIDSR